MGTKRIGDKKDSRLGICLFLFEHKKIRDEAYVKNLNWDSPPGPQHPRLAHHPPRQDQAARASCGVRTW